MAIPGGVNCTLRSFGEVGGEPYFAARGRGSRLWNSDRRELLDYVGCRGALILGHAPRAVVAAVRKAAAAGIGFAMPTAGEVELAEAVVRAFPSMELLRLVNSGTEAAMGALRLARGFTGRSKVIKFAGACHGHVDALMVRSGSGSAAFSVPDSQGVPDGHAADTLVAEYNDLESVRRLLEQHGPELAAIIVEPAAGNMGVVPPAEGFLPGLRSMATDNGSLLVFDEVTTGFRVARGGAQRLYGVRPDLTILGKILGGGLPVGACGGRRDVMEHFAPPGPVHLSGALSGNPLVAAAGLATLDILESRDVHGTIERRSAALERGLAEAAASAGAIVCINRVGSMLTVFFTDGPVTDLASARRADTGRYARFFHAMLDAGIGLPPSQFEALFVSLAHSDLDIARTLEAARGAFKASE